MAAGRCERWQCLTLWLIKAVSAASGASSAAVAAADQPLSVLLKQLQAKPLGLYDGMRLFRVQQPSGGSHTLAVSCEREQWLVQNSNSAQGRPTFYNTPFLSAKGIKRTWVCSTPMRVQE